MPRRLLRDGHIVDDDWRYVDEIGDNAGAGLIVPFDRWTAERDAWLRVGGRLGVLVGPASRVESLVEDLPALSLIAAEFPSPSEGRGYSQARLLRERWNFSGELRAIGHVRQDQVFFMARCGFNAFELPEAEFEAAQRALHTFTAAYQPANDAGLDRELRHRQPPP